MNYKGLIEGLLFVTGDEGLTLIDLCSIIGVSDNIILSSLNELINDYKNSDRVIQIELFIGVDIALQYHGRLFRRYFDF